MSAYTHAELYRRGLATLVASWEEYAMAAEDAAVRRLDGFTVAVFPQHPERSVYNNTLVDSGLDTHRRADAFRAIERLYRDAGVDRFDVWVHESDHVMRDDVERNGYRAEATTRAMGMSLMDRRLQRPTVELAPPDWHEHLRIAEVPPGVLSRADPNAYRVAVAQLDGENAATAMALHFDGDCGIYNVSTLHHARNRGLGTAVTAALLWDAVERGCRTASLQATPVAERLYARLGFRDLGRILEHRLVNPR